VESLYDEATIDAIGRLKQDVAALADGMGLAAHQDIDEWNQAIETRLLPRLMPEFPLVAAICGGGSSGKSTLFNTLVGEPVSPTGGRAGINRRMLVALSAAHKSRSGIAEAIFDPFGCPPQPLGQMDQLTTPGDPLLHYAAALVPGLVLVDTPDFDTGAKGDYQNREMAERALRAADVLIYIFTNANYNNRDNTDFVARMLTAVGTRHCFLVYRADPGFTDAEIRDHAGTVGRNLYGDGAAQHVLGVFRALEDNRVAAGNQPMTIAALDGQASGLMDALTLMDPRQVRGNLHRSIFRAVVGQGDRLLREARDAARHLEVYLEGLRTVQRRCVQDALGRLPMDAVVRRFSEIWQATDPSHIKIMRKTGQVLEMPVRLMMRVAKWVGGKGRQGRMQAAGELAATMETDLVQAAGRLRQAAVDPAIAITLPKSDPAMATLRDAVRQLAGRTGVTENTADVETATLTIPLPAALAETQTAMRNLNWSALVDEMLAKKEAILSLTRQLEAELKRLAGEQRARMTTLDQIRQTFSAMLNVIPATAAVTYVLHTGDPVGAVGIKVKLAGLFGLNDLYALVAIPATAGMKKADLKQLEALLGPVAQAWLTHKLKAIEALFETHITGSMLREGEAASTLAAERISSMQQHLAQLRSVLERQP
jgi:hypothetical protein